MFNILSGLSGSIGSDPERRFLQETYRDLESSCWENKTLVGHIEKEWFWRRLFHVFLIQTWISIEHLECWWVSRIWSLNIHVLYTVFLFYHIRGICCTLPSTGVFHRNLPRDSKEKTSGPDVAEVPPSSRCHLSWSWGSQPAAKLVSWYHIDIIWCKRFEHLIWHLHDISYIVICSYYQAKLRSLHPNKAVLLDDVGVCSQDMQRLSFPWAFACELGQLSKPYLRGGDGWGKT